MVAQANLVPFSSSSSNLQRAEVGTLAFIRSRSFSKRAGTFMKYSDLAAVAGEAEISVA